MRRAASLRGIEEHPDLVEDCVSMQHFYHRVKQQYISRKLSDDVPCSPVISRCNKPSYLFQCRGSVCSPSSGGTRAHCVHCACVWEVTAQP